MASRTLNPDLVYAMLADARLPTGSHAHSAGLEAVVQGGLAAEDRLTEVPAYAASRLRTVTAVEAGTAVVARHLWVEGRAGELPAVEDAWAARTPSAPLRAAARQLGRGYARLARKLWPDALSADRLERLGVRAELRYPRPVVLGIIAGVAGLDAGRLAHLVGYEDVQSVTSAALKLLPLDPVTASGWLLDLDAAITDMAGRVVGLTEPHLIPACGAPLLDLHAARHEISNRRLFRA